MKEMLTPELYEVWLNMQPGFERLRELNKYQQDQ